MLQIYLGIKEQWETFPRALSKMALSKPVGEKEKIDEKVNSELHTF